MSFLNPGVEGDTTFFDGAECKARGAELHEQYVDARPFPHVLIDDFLPLAILRRVVAEFPERRPGRFANRRAAPRPPPPAPARRFLPSFSPWGAPGPPPPLRNRS